MKKTFLISAIALLTMVSCNQKQTSPFEWNTSKYDVVDIEVPDLSGISDNGKEVLNLYRFAADEVNDIYWKQYFGDKASLLENITDSVEKTFVEINYGPWDRQDGKAFVGGYDDRTPGANFYPADMTAAEFAAYDNPDKNSPYTLIRRADDGSLQTVWYHEAFAEQIEKIRLSAHRLHNSVNQTYGDSLPYGYHLDMVAGGIHDFGHLVCAGEDDIVPLFFGGYYHDSIEDARLTYNDVMAVARQFLPEEKAPMATEIVYALTNDKGRTRAERAGEKYYRGIRETPYAPFVKLCDRLANITYSCSGEDPGNRRMKEVYKQEMPHFLPSINPGRHDDARFLVPHETVLRLAECLIDDMEREERNGRGWWNEY